MCERGKRRSAYTDILDRVQEKNQVMRRLVLVLCERPE